MAYLSGLNRDKPYALTCGLSPLEGGGEMEAFTDKVTRYRRSIRAQGGFWEATFFIPLGVKAPEYYLRRWFRDRIGWRFTERTGGSVTWQGVIWEMELSLNGSKQRRDMGAMFNAIKMIYTNRWGEARELAWSTNDASISKYGRRELILSKDRIATTVATAQVAAEIKNLSDVWVHTTSFNARDDGLFVTVVGDVFTANNKYVTAGDGTEDNVSTYIREIIETDCDYLTPGTITTNTLQVRKEFNSPIRAWDALMDLVEMGDGTDPYELRVGVDGIVYYGPADNTPRFEWLGRERGLVSVIGDRNPWRAQPGPIRDKTQPDIAAVPGSFLQQGNDAWLAEIEMADGQDEITPKVNGYDPESIMQGADQAQKWLEKGRFDRGEDLERYGKTA